MTVRQGDPVVADLTAVVVADPSPTTTPSGLVLPADETAPVDVSAEPVVQPPPKPSGTCILLEDGRWVEIHKTKGPRIPQFREYDLDHHAYEHVGEDASGEWTYRRV